VRELRKSLGLGGIALLSIACCVGLPLIVAAGFKSTRRSSTDPWSMSDLHATGSKNRA